MRSDQPRPELSAIEYNRRFGRYDFHRFDHLVRQHASVGAASLGKVNVDCRFLFEKSKWGTLEGQDSAGIIYLDLALSQPSDCRLKSATVQVTLDDDDEQLPRHVPPEDSWLPVQIDKYGPREMTGEPQYERIAVHDTLIPTFNLGNLGGIEGMGREKYKHRLRECRWKFESYLTTGSRKKGKDNRTYKVIRWHIKENELQDQSQQSNTVHTAFSFVHSGQPFFMRVEVSGRLESRASDFRHQIKHRIKRLKFPPSPQDAKCATTLIAFHDRDRFTTPLDQLNQRLESAMEQANMTSPVEISKNKWQMPAQSRPGEPVQEPSATRPYANQENTQPQIEDVTGPTNETVASLSNWLMAPPVRPLVVILEPEPEPEPVRQGTVVTMVSEPEPEQSQPEQPPPGKPEPEQPEPEPEQPEPERPQPEPQVQAQVQELEEEAEEEIVVVEESPGPDQVPSDDSLQTEAAEVPVLVLVPADEEEGEEEKAEEDEEEDEEDDEEAGSEVEEEQPIVVIHRPRGLQRQRHMSAEDRVDLSTVVFLVRMWMAQTLAAFFGLRRGGGVVVGGGGGRGRGGDLVSESSPPLDEELEEHILVG